MAISTEQQQNVIALTVAMFGAAPGANNLSEFAQALENGSSLSQLANNLAKTDTFNSQYAGQVTQEDKIGVALNNLGIEEGTDAYTEAASFFDARLDAGTPVSDVFIEAGTYLLSDNVSEAFADVATQYQNRIDVATYYSVDQAQSGDSLDALKDVVNGVTADPATVEAAKEDIEGGTGGTFMLTQGIDQALTGTDGNDTFTALSALSSGDVIDGGEGTDTLKATLTSDSVTTPTLLSVENVQVRSIGAERNISLANADSVESVSVANSNAATVIGDVGSATNFAVANQTGDATFNDITATGGINLKTTNVGTASTPAAVTLAAVSATSLNLTTSNSNIDLSDSTFTALESVSVQVAQNSIVQGLDNNSDAALTALTVTGQGDLDLTSSGISSLETLNAGEATGNINLGASSSLTDATLGAGDDTLTLYGLGEEASLAGGAGDDTLIIQTVDLTVDLAALLADDSTVNVSGFETLGVSELATSIDASALPDEVTRLYLDSTAVGAAVTNLESGSDILTFENGAGTVTDTDPSGATVLSLAGDDSDSDSLGFTVVDGDGDGDGYVLDASNIETLNVTTQNGDAAGDVATLAITDDALTTLNISGDQAVAFDDAGSMNNLETIDLSGLNVSELDEDEYAADITANSVNGVTVNGSEAADTIQLAGSATATGNGGNDLFEIQQTDSTAQYSTITDFQSGDMIDFFGDTGTEVFNSSAITLASTATFQQYLEAATATDVNTTGGTGNSEINWFQFSGDTFAVQDNANSGGADAVGFETGVDGLVRLTGQVDLSEATITDGALTIA